MSSAEFGDLRRTWDQAAINDLRRLWPQPEHSARTIGALLGFTRNAIISKAHRLGLAGDGKKLTVYSRDRPPEHRPRPYTRKNRVSIPGWAPKLSLAPKGQNASYRPRNVRLFDLRAKHCRWPLWDLSASTGFFCGSDACEGLAYCKHHASMAYRKAGPVRLRLA